MLISLTASLLIFESSLNKDLAPITVMIALKLIRYINIVLRRLKTFFNQFLMASALISLLRPFKILRILFMASIMIYSYITTAASSLKSYARRLL
jgi:hypothetical protein